jgi:hypothetical protein
VIYPLNNLVQVPGQSPRSLVVNPGKSHASHGTAPKERQLDAAVTWPADAAGLATLGQPIPTNNPLTAILSPIGDRDQAAAASQLARRLILAQPSAAILAQANSNSQSVERLLQ